MATTGWRGSWHRRRYPIPSRQCLHRYWELGGGTGPGRQLGSGVPASQARPFADCYCPILKQIEESYHWSLDEAEYATDIVFRRQADLQTIYGNLIRTAIHTVKPDDIANFSAETSRQLPGRDGQPLQRAH